MSQGGLLFYDPTAGEGQFYIINNGRIGQSGKTHSRTGAIAGHR